MADSMAGGALLSLTGIFLDLYATPGLPDSVYKVWLPTWLGVLT